MPDQPVSQPQPNLAPPDTEKSMADPQSATEIPKPPQPKRKTPFLIVLVIVLFTSILFIPIPHYQSPDNLRCKPGQECKTGWLFNPSLYRSLVDFILQTNRSETVPLTSPTPTPDPTANWKTYTNNNYQFTFKFPPQWVLTEKPNADLPYIVHLLTFMNPSENPQENQVLTIEIYDQFLVKAIPEDKVIKTETILVGGVQGNKNWHNAFGSNSLEVTVKPTVNTFRIIWPNESLEDLFDQILSTFEFTLEKCDTCPQFSPPSPEFCSNGIRVPGEIDGCGCQGPPTCQQSK